MVVTQLGGARAETAAPGGYSVVSAADLYHGVGYVKLARAAKPVVAHVAHIEPKAPVELRVVNANDRIAGSTRQLELTSSMCERVQCIVGVNGDFHTGGVPAGAVVIDGRLLHSPAPDRPQLSVLEDGSLVAGTFPWTASLTAAGFGPLPLTEVNEAPAINGLAVFTPEFGRATPASTRTELVVKGADVGALNRAADLQLVSLRTGGGPIPANGAVLSGDGTAAQQLADLWSRRQALGGRARLLLSSPVEAVMSIGAEPVVLKDGRRASPWRDPNVVSARQPHTLVGWNKAGDIYLVAVDGRQAASEGMTMAEAADFLLSLGVTDAVNLDGGGGTTFVAGGTVWNRPSDNDPARPGDYDERGATNALVVMARPGAPLPPPAPPIPAPGTSPESAPSSGGHQPAPVVPGSVLGGPGTDGAPSSPPGGAALPGDDADAGADGGGPALIDPLTGVAVELAGGDLPIIPSAAGPTLRSRGRVTPLTGSTAGRSAEPRAGGGSLVAEARTELHQRQGRSRSDDGNYLQDTLELAAALTSPGLLPSAGEGNSDRGPNAAHALIAAGAVCGVAALTLGRRRTRRPRLRPSAP